MKFNQNEQKEFKNAISAINEKIKVREDREDHIITKLNEVTKENKLIKEKLLALDVYIRRENLKFSGLMEDDNESALQCQKKIYGLFKNQLKIVNSERIEFQRCHRLSRKTDGKTRDRIVRFLKFPDRQTIWNAKNHLKGSNIIVHEDFPPEIDQRRARLFPIFIAARSQNMKASLIADKLTVNGKKYNTETLDLLPLSIQPKSLATKRDEDIVMFYGRDAFLSNFYPSNFTMDAKKFYTVEQYYQYKKACAAGDQDTADLIMKTMDPSEHHRMARKFGTDVWNNQTAVEIMEEGVAAKFTQNPELKALLLDTGTKQITECNKYETFWANGLSLHDQNSSNRNMWRGKNHLGNILVKVRDDLR